MWEKINEDVEETEALSQKDRYEYIDGLTYKKTAGPDNISGEMLKKRQSIEMEIFQMIRLW